MESDSTSSSPTDFLAELIQLILQAYLEVFQIYNDRFISFAHLFQQLEKKHLVSLEDFHQAILELEKQKYFLLGGYSKKQDIPFPNYSLFLPERGYLYWIFRPEASASDSEKMSTVIDFL
ncbi:MAG: hypothetical protein AABZ60_14760 [Planctomycetota bacterium]